MEGGSSLDVEVFRLEHVFRTRLDGFIALQNGHAGIIRLLHGAGQEVHIVAPVSFDEVGDVRRVRW